MKHEPLRLWRTMTPVELKDLPNASADLAAFLTSRLVPEAPQDRALFDQLLCGYHSLSALTLAKRTGARRRRRDAAMSFILVAALGGSQVAALSLSQTLFAITRDLRGELRRVTRAEQHARLRQEARRTFRLAPAWFAELRTNVLDQQLVWKLTAYSPAMNALLDEVSDRLGLVALGWSGKWDATLRAALIRTEPALSALLGPAPFNSRD